MTPPPPGDTDQGPAESDRDAVARALLPLRDQANGFGSVYAMADAVLACLAQRGRLVGEWVACGDRLPVDGLDVLVIDGIWTDPLATSYSVADRSGNRWWSRDDDMATPMYWRPLPPPPRVPGEGA
jgi:hypothetical protein